MPVRERQGSVAIIGAGNYIGAAIARRFAAEGFITFAGRRSGDRLTELTEEITAAGGRAHGRHLDARVPEVVIAFLAEAEAMAPLEAVIFNVGANVAFPIVGTTDSVFRKVWEMSCFSGFVAGRRAARPMLRRERGSIFFTGRRPRRVGVSAMLPSPPPRPG